MEKLDLRKWNPNDLESLVKYANNWNIAKNMTDIFPFPYTKTDGISFIDFANQENQNHIFAIDIDGEAVGSIGLHLQNDIYKKNAELGYWLAETFWNNGIMSKLITIIVDFGFNNCDIQRIYARPFGTNIASQKCLEKCGFLLEAKLQNTLFKNGEYFDELIYSIRKNEWKQKTTNTQQRI